ncbi:MAG: sensor histidine kinase [Pseudomonadales bacterium]
MNWTATYHSRNFAKLLMAVIIVQAVYWLFLSPLSQRPPLQDFHSIAPVEVARLNEPNFAAAQALSDSAWQTVEPFWFGCCDQKHYAFRYSFDSDPLATEDLGIVAAFGADNYHVWVNGFPLIDDGRLEPLGTYHARWTRGVNRISKSMLRRGENQVIAITVRNGGGYTDLFPQTLGDFEALTRASAKRTFMLNDFRLVTMVVFGLLAGFATVLIPTTRNRPFTVWLAILAWALTLRIAYYRWWDPPLNPEWLTIYYLAVANLVPLAWFNFLDAWSGRGLPKARALASGLFAVLMVGITLMILNNRLDGFLIADKLSQAFAVVMGCGAAGMLLWRALTIASNRYWEVAVFSLVLTAMIIDAGYEFVLQTNVGNLQFAQPFLMLAFVAAMITRNVKLYESTQAFNEELNATLALREREIEQRHKDLQDARKRRILAEERQRLLRDMHDGIGSHLTGLLVQTRNTPVDVGDLQQNIEHALNDLRLVIESLDTKGDSFLEVADALRTRLATQLQRTGIDLNWQVSHEPSGELSATDILQLARIIQEATSNVIQHSGAKRMTILTSQSEAGFVLSMVDDGHGASDLTGESAAGRGVESMRARALQLGGELSIELVCGAAAVSLTLPRQRPENSA